VAAARALGLDLRAVAARTADGARALAGDAGVAAIALDDLPRTDLVVVATPPPTHVAVTRRAREAGAAVLVEAPVATTLAGADELVAAAGGDGVAVAAAEALVHAPVVRSFLRRLPALGPLGHLSARAVQSGPRAAGAGAGAGGGALVGGALVDLGPPLVALALLAARPAAVVAVRARLDDAAGCPGVDEHAEVALRFDDGLVAEVVASWRGPATPAWDLQAASATGVLRAELLPVPSLEHDGEPVALPAPRSALRALDDYGYLGLLASWSQDVAAGRRPFADAALGRAVLEVLVAAAASAAPGTEVALPFSGPRDRSPAELRGAAPSAG
jgi:predicted dehydrogenase